MGDNFIVSSDEERRMNEILDKGIDELKYSSNFIKSDIKNKSTNVLTEMVKSNNNSSQNNPYISEKKNSNNEKITNEILYQNKTLKDFKLKCENKEKDENSLTSNNINKINQIKHFIREDINNKNHNNDILMINNKISGDTKNKTTKNYISDNNHKNNLDNLKLNYNLNENSNTMQNLKLADINNNSTLTSNNTFNMNKKDFNNLDLNKVVEITEKDIYSQTFKNNNPANFEEKPAAKSSALKALLEEMKNTNNYLNESNENILSGITSRNMSSRLDNKNFKENLNINYNSQNEIMLNSNKLNSDIPSFNHMNNIINKDQKKLRSSLSVGSNDSNTDINLDDMKNEIDSLQNKIDGLEKKLFDRSNSRDSIDVKFQSHSRSISKNKIKNNLLSASKNLNSCVLKTPNRKNSNDSTKFSKNKDIKDLISPKNLNKSYERKNYEKNNFYTSNKTHINKNKLSFDSDGLNINSSHELSQDNNLNKSKKSKLMKYSQDYLKSPGKNELNTSKRDDNNKNTLKTFNSSRRSYSNISKKLNNLQNENSSLVEGIDKSDDEINSKNIKNLINKTKDILNRSISTRRKNNHLTKLNEKNDYSDIDKEIIKDKNSQIDDNDFENDNNSECQKIKLKSKNKKKKIYKIKRKTDDESELVKGLTFTNERINKNYSHTNNINLYTNDSNSRISSRKNTINLNNKSPLLTNNISNKSFSIKSKNKIIENDKEKILKIKDKNDLLKISLKEERKKVDDCQKKLKRNKYKEDNYDNLETNFINLQKDYNKLLKNYNQSELIRKEQSKLIQSMKYEIDLLKDCKNKISN